MLIAISGSLQYLVKTIVETALWLSNCFELFGAVSMRRQFCLFTVPVYYD